MTDDKGPKRHTRSLTAHFVLPPETRKEMGLVSIGRPTTLINPFSPLVFVRGHT